MKVQTYLGQKRYDFTFDPATGAVRDRTGFLLTDKTFLTKSLNEQCRIIKKHRRIKLQKRFGKSKSQTPRKEE